MMSASPPPRSDWSRCMMDETRANICRIILGIIRGHFGRKNTSINAQIHEGMDDGDGSHKRADDHDRGPQGKRSHRSAFPVSMGYG